MTNYDAANRLTTFGYKPAGIRRQRQSHVVGLDDPTTYQWNARYRLASTSAGSASFAYDSLGRRSGRTVNSTTTSYLHDGLNPVLVNGDFMLDGPGLDEIYAEVSATGTRAS